MSARIARLAWPVLAIIIAVAGSAMLFLQPRTIDALGPAPDAPSYALQAIEISEGNFVSIPFVGEYQQEFEGDDELYPSRYPPGLSVLLAVFPLVTADSADLSAVLWGSAVISVLVLLATGFVAGRIGGWPAAAVALVAVLASPFLAKSSTMVMADAQACLLAVIALYLFHRADRALAAGRRGTGLHLAIGLVLGYATFSRLSMIVLLVVAIVIARRPRAILLIAAGAAPWGLALLGYQWWAYGSPLTTGYDYWLPGLEEFRPDAAFVWDGLNEGPFIYPDRLEGTLMQWTCPCPYPAGGVMSHTPAILTYPAAFLGIYWVVIPPFLALFGVFWSVRTIRTRATQFAVGAVLGLGGLYFFYIFQGVRFIAPAIFLVLILSSAGLVDVVRRLVRRLQGWPPADGLAETAPSVTSVAKTAQREPEPSVAPPASRLTRRLSILLIGTLCAAALVAGALLAPTVGLQYDEVLFVNGATDPTTAHFVALRFGQVPILLMDYIGALKAWLYAPLFTVFGVSVEVVRIPMVIAFVGAVALLARLVWRRSRPWVAILLTALLVVEPAFTLMSRNDWGPVALSGLLRVLLVVALVAFVEGRRLRWGVLAAAVLALGIFNKLDFAIPATAILFAAGIVFAPRLASIVRSRPRASVLLGFLVLATYAAAYLLMYRRSTGAVKEFIGTWWERLDSRIRLVVDSFDGHMLTNYMTGSQLGIGSPSIVIACGIGLLAAIVAAALWLRNRRSAPATPLAPGALVSPGRLLAFAILAGLGTFLGFVVVSEISGPHHAALIWPFPWLIIALSCAYLAEKARTGALASWAAVAAGLLTLVVLAGQVVASVGIASILTSTTDRPPIWTRDTAGAATAITADAPTGTEVVVITADWGIANQLTTYDIRADRLDVRDIWPSVTTEPPQDLLTESGLPGTFYLAYHPTGHEAFAGGAQAARALVIACEANGGTSDVVYRGDDIVVRELACTP